LCREPRKCGGLFAIVLEESILIDQFPQLKWLGCLCAPVVGMVTAPVLVELLNCGNGFFLVAQVANSSHFS